MKRKDTGKGPLNDKNPVIDSTEQNANLNRKRTIPGILYQAVMANNTDHITRLLESNPEVIHKKIKGYDLSFLHTAAYKGAVEATELLLDKGAKIDAIGSQSLTPLHCAATSVSERRVKVIELLLDRGANVDLKDANGSSALHLAVDKNHVDVVELLLERGEKTDNYDLEFSTFKLALERFKSLVAELKSKKGEENDEIYAAAQKRSKILLAFVRSKNFKLEPNPQNASELNLNNTLDLAFELIDPENNVASIDNICRDLCRECEKGSSLEFIKYFIAKAGGIKKINDQLAKECKKDIPALIHNTEKNPQLNEFKVATKTPLSAAALSGNAHIVDYLLKEGDDLNVIINNNGMFSIFYGVCEKIKKINDELVENIPGKQENLNESLRQYLKIAEIFIEHGADLQDKTVIKYLSTVINSEKPNESVADNQKTISEERNKDGKTPYGILKSANPWLGKNSPILNDALSEERQALSEKRQEIINTEQEEKISLLSNSLTEALTEIASLKKMVEEMSKMISSKGDKRPISEVDTEVPSTEVNKRPRTERATLVVQNSSTNSTSI